MRGKIVLVVLAAALSAPDALAFDSAGEVAEAVRDSVAACHQETEEERYEVKALHSLEHFALGPGDEALELLPPKKPCQTGRQTFHVRVERDRRVVLVPVGIEVKRYVRALGVRRDVTRGASLAPSDVEHAWFDVTYGRAHPVTGVAELEGHVARSRIRRGSMLTHDLLEIEPVIRSGAPVTVRVLGDGFRIELDGVARDDGAEGERIRVKNLSSGRILRATVVGPGLVEI